MVAMGSNINDTGTFFLLTVLVQCARVGLMLWIERGDDKLKILLGVAGRALFLLVSAIYCFGVISQSVFCGVLSTQVDPGRSNSCCYKYLLTSVIYSFVCPRLCDK